MTSEKRLIDANALLELVQFRLPIDSHNAEVIAGCVDITRRLVQNAPTVDAVEVCRCKDCKHQSKVWISDKRMKEKGYFIYGCTYQEFGELGADDDFCSYGERRTDNG